MRQDIIVKFIMSDENHLALALQVEKAMTHVKKKLIKEVKEGIRNRLEQWGENENWEVVPSTDKNVFVLQRKDWPESRGIDLRCMWGADIDYLRVSLPDNIEVNKFQAAFGNHIDSPIYRSYNVIYQEIINHNTEEDLTKVMRKDETVIELTRQIKDWAIAVDKALDDLK